MGKKAAGEKGRLALDKNPFLFCKLHDQTNIGVELIR
jgi:hypothetical protein